MLTALFHINGQTSSISTEPSTTMESSNPGGLSVSLPPSLLLLLLLLLLSPDEDGGGGRSSIFSSITRMQGA